MGTPNQPPAPGTASGSGLSSTYDPAGPPPGPSSIPAPTTPSTPPVDHSGDTGTAPPPYTPPTQGQLDAAAPRTWTGAMANAYNNALVSGGVNAPRHNAGDVWNPVQPQGQTQGNQSGGVGSAGQLYGNGGLNQYGANSGANAWSGISSPGASWNPGQQYTGPTASQFFGPVGSALGTLGGFTPLGAILGAIGRGTGATTGYMGTGQSGIFGDAQPVSDPNAGVLPRPPEPTQ